MKKGMLIVLVMLMPIAMGINGCETLKGMVSPLHKPDVVEMERTAAEKALDAAHKAVDEANSTLIAYDSYISAKANERPPTVSKAKLQAGLNKSVEFGKQLDLARQSMGMFNLSDARIQAESLKALILVWRASLTQK